MNPIPFVTREVFEQTKPDPLFPIHNYDICKMVWETSPLIEALCKAILNQDTALTRPALYQLPNRPTQAILDQISHANRITQTNSYKHRA